MIAHSFDHDIYFAGVPEYKPANDHVIIDVGAHIGTFSLLAASKVPSGRVYAVEACKESFHLLRINAVLNHATNIKTIHLALSNQPGTCILHYDKGNWGHTISRPLTGCGETVATDSLDNFIAAQNILHCHFMKLNCEGAEFPILLGASADTLRRFETILVLYHCDLSNGGSEADLLAHLHSSGFTTSVRSQTESRGWIIAINSAGKIARCIK